MYKCELCGKKPELVEFMYFGENKMCEMCEHCAGIVKDIVAAEKEDTREDAHQEGYDEGYKSGYEDGYITCNRGEEYNEEQKW